MNEELINFIPGMKSLKHESLYLDTLVDKYRHRLENATIQQSDGSFAVENNIRMCRTSYIKEVEEPGLFQMLMKEISSIAPSELGSLAFVNLLSYEVPGESHYNWHRDVLYETDGKPGSRYISFVLQMTEESEYEGCDLQLDYISDLGCRELYTLIVFPSRERHRVTRLTAGIRRSIVGWITLK